VAQQRKGAKQIDGFWLSREMGGYADRWVDKQRNGWLDREMGGQAVRWVAKQLDGRLSRKMGG
jgi:hypothetical protein